MLKQSPSAAPREIAGGTYTHPVIDYHSHILPGIDDGSRDIDMSLELLRRSAQAGVDIMVATPHFYGYRTSLSRFLRRREEAWAQLSSCLDESWPKILPGAEVALFDGLLSVKGLEHLCIQGTNALLLEMPFGRWSNYDLDAVATLSLDRGFQVVLAHYERYLGIRQDSMILNSLQDLPLTIQINAESLLHFHSRRTCLEWFKNGRAHLLGSDCHDLKHRPPRLGEARALLLKKLGPDILSKIDADGSALLPEVKEPIL